MRPSLPALLGLTFGVALFAAPFVLNYGKPQAQGPVLAGPSHAPCIEPAEAMRINHMKILHTWRTKSVREQTRTERVGDTVRTISLNTCRDCHGPVDTFCTPCHDMHSIRPTCWSCHYE